MSHKGELTVGVTGSFSIFNIEQISSANKWLFVPPIAIHSINCNCLLFSINCYSFVQALLIRAKVSELETQILIVTLDNFNSVIVNLAHMTYSCVLAIQIVDKSPSGSLRPVQFLSQVVFRDHVLIRFKSKTHFINYNLN